ncbi:hypothetical protein JCM19237_545 [Photobacterium aphoticum]|uniref:Uncharacterized protein n=1 Tax=Photobacterium aphoticum TaxID=754436 RepID=A0A090QQM3_9GAMM|nr:hypothetical protein JCM19237_545 [Photobacterium aphoticum]
MVKNKCTGELEHWEVAIKFYLAWEQQWPGPNAKDNLDKKAQRMLSTSCRCLIRRPITPNSLISLGNRR